MLPILFHASLVAMKKVFLGGTTTGTTWRVDLTKRLVARGIDEDSQIINPHLPPGVPYTAERMEEERRAKNDPHTIVLIVVRPAVTKDPSRAELLGPISMYEIGRFAHSQPKRTAIVLQAELFTKGGRPRKVLEGLAAELCKEFGGRPPYFASIEAAEDWIVAQLT